MLVLSRKRDEKILIAGGLIVVQVLEIRGDKVRIGITAPNDVSVHREEIQTAIEKREEAEAELAKAAS